MPKFAANLSMMFNELPFLERFEAAAAEGFTAVEFLFPYDYPAELLAEQLRSNGLQQVLFNTAPGNAEAGEWGLAAVPGREQDARADIDRALAYAIALNCPNVHVMAGVVPPGADWQRYRDTFIDNIRYAADRFAQHGIKVLIEALSPQVKPHYLFSSQHQAAGTGRGHRSLERLRTVRLFPCSVGGRQHQRADAFAGRPLRPYSDCLGAGSS